MIWIAFFALVAPRASNAQWLLLDEDSPAQFTTEADAKIPPRHECGAWCIGDDIYVYGGRNDDPLGIRDFWKYETENRRWLWMPEPPLTLEGLKNFAYWTIREEIYLYGGDSSVAGIQSTMWNYKPTTRRWTIIQPTGPLGPGPVETAAFWVHKPSNQLYLFGAYDGNTTRSELWAFNVLSGSWRLVNYAGTVPATVDHQCSAVMGKSEDTVYYFCDHLYQLDLPTLTWSKSPTGPMEPQQRRQYAMFMTNTQDKIALFSGRMGSELYADYWLYDPAIEQWINTEKSGGPSARWGACGCTDGRGDYYMFGGTFEDPTHFHNDLWKNGPLTAKNIFQLLDFKLDSVTLSSLVAAAMSTILVCVLFFALLCICVKKCRRERHLINSYKADNGPLNESISL